MKWFKHSCLAAQDAKLKKLRIKYGMQGYGLYWYCLELIASEVDSSKLTFELEHDSEILAHDTGINYQVVQEMMNYMVDLGLFESAGGMITCFALAKRADEYLIKSLKREGKIEELERVRTMSGQRLDKVCPDKSRLDKIKLDKNRDSDSQKRKRFSPPSFQDVSDYFFEKSGNSSSAQKFIDFYESKGWMVGKNKMKDWKASVRNWISREKESAKPANKKQTDDYYQQLANTEFR